MRIYEWMNCIRIDAEIMVICEVLWEGVTERAFPSFPNPSVQSMPFIGAHEARVRVAGETEEQVRIPDPQLIMSWPSSMAGTDMPGSSVKRDAATNPVTPPPQIT